MSIPSEIVTNGYWDGEPIWRRKTAEDRLHEMGVETEVMNLGIEVLGNKDTARNILKI